MRAFLVLSLLLFAATVEAGPIQFTQSGCVTALPEGASWVGEDFLFMAFHSPEKGCAPTIENPTRGVFIESTNPDGLFRVDVRPEWLPTCGKVQMDAHARLPNGGLDPTGLYALVFDTGKNCETSSRFVPPEPPVTVSVPDTSSSLMLLFGSVLFCGIARRKSQ